MKAFLFVCLVAVCHASLTPDFSEEWLSFKSKHGKKYSNPMEEHYRMGVFHKNKQLIDEHNQRASQGLETFTLKMNHFGDLTTEEFKGLMNKYQKPESKLGSTFVAPENAAIPDSIDWRSKGAVTPVKDQGQCGSCWAFSTTGSMEGQIFRKTGKLVSFSEQQLVDCSTANSGCNGGLMDEGFKYIKKSGGLETEQAYPYEGEDNSCRFKKSKAAGTVTGFVDIPTGDEEALKKAVATVGPVSVAIDAGQPSFQFYSSGVYNERRCSSEELDHGVLAVGYGTENGQDYWLVKNSWNTVWGDQGYIKMARNANNKCGIATMASYPLV